MQFLSLLLCTSAAALVKQFNDVTLESGEHSRIQPLLRNFGATAGSLVQIHVHEAKPQGSLVTFSVVRSDILESWRAFIPDAEHVAPCGSPAVLTWTAGTGVTLSGGIPLREEYTIIVMRCDGTINGSITISGNLSVDNRFSHAPLSAARDSALAAQFAAAYACAATVWTGLLYYRGWGGALALRMSVLIVAVARAAQHFASFAAARNFSTLGLPSMLQTAALILSAVGDTLFICISIFIGLGSDYIANHNGRPARCRRTVATWALGILMLLLGTQEAVCAEGLDIALADYNNDCAVIFACAWLVRAVGLVIAITLYFLASIAANQEASGPWSPSTPAAAARAVILAWLCASLTIAFLAVPLAHFLAMGLQRDWRDTWLGPLIYHIALLASAIVAGVALVPPPAPPGSAGDDRDAYEGIATGVGREIAAASESIALAAEATAARRVASIVQQMSPVQQSYRRHRVAYLG